MRLHELNAQFLGQRHADEHAAETGNDQFHAFTRGQPAPRKSERIDLRILAHLRQDGEEVALFQQFAHLRALRHILRVAFDRPELDAVRLDQRSEIFMCDEPHHVPRLLQALAQGQIRLNISATA